MKDKIFLLVVLGLTLLVVWGSARVMVLTIKTLPLVMPAATPTPTVTPEPTPTAEFAEFGICQGGEETFEHFGLTVSFMVEEDGDLVFYGEKGGVIRPIDLGAVGVHYQVFLPKDVCVWVFGQIDPCPDGELVFDNTDFAGPDGEVYYSQTSFYIDRIKVNLWRQEPSEWTPVEPDEVGITIVPLGGAYGDLACVSFQ